MDESSFFNGFDVAFIQLTLEAMGFG